eukprot:9851817-Ditylum_brightwellii.AAC.1
MDETLKARCTCGVKKELYWRCQICKIGSVSDTAEADNNMLLDEADNNMVLNGMEYGVSFTVVSDAAKADYNIVLDGMEHAVSIMGVSDEAEIHQKQTITWCWMA